MELKINDFLYKNQDLKDRLDDIKNYYDFELIDYDGRSRLANELQETTSDFQYIFNIDGKPSELIFLKINDNEYYITEAIRINKNLINFIHNYKDVWAKIAIVDYYDNIYVAMIGKNVYIDDNKQSEVKLQL